MSGDDRADVDAWHHRHGGDVLHLLAQLHISSTRSAGLTGCLAQCLVGLAQCRYRLAMLGLNQAQRRFRLQQFPVVGFERDLARLVGGRGLGRLPLCLGLRRRQLLNGRVRFCVGEVICLGTLLAALKLFVYTAQRTLGALAITGQDKGSVQCHVSRSPSCH